MDFGLHSGDEDDDDDNDDDDDRNYENIDLKPSNGRAQLVNITSSSRFPGGHAV